MIINTDTNTTVPTEFRKWSTRREKKHAIKIPSSLGLFIVDSSCFLVSGPEVQKAKGGRETKDKVQTDCICRKNTKQKNKSRLKEKNRKR